MLAITYNTTSKFGFDFNTRLYTLHHCISNGAAFQRCLEVIERSPSRHQKEAWAVAQVEEVRSSLGKLVVELDAAKAAYKAFFDHYHPSGSIQKICLDCKSLVEGFHI